MINSLSLDFTRRTSEFTSVLQSWILQQEHVLVCALEFAAALGRSENQLLFYHDEPSLFEQLLPLKGGPIVKVQAVDFLAHGDLVVIWRVAINHHQVFELEFLEQAFDLYIIEVAQYPLSVK
jgi:hypothetical protein